MGLIVRDKYYFQMGLIIKDNDSNKQYIGVECK